MSSTSQIQRHVELLWHHVNDIRRHLHGVGIRITELESRLLVVEYDVLDRSALLHEGLHRVRQDHAMLAARYVAAGRLMAGDL